MSQSGYSLAATWRAIANGWNDFFHRPLDTRIAAIVRIAYAAVLLVNLLVLLPDLALWFTDQGVLPTTVSRELRRGWDWSLLWHVPGTIGAVRICFFVFLLQAALLLVGLFSRLNAACVLAWLISFQNRNAQILDGEDSVFIVIALCLALMPCGHCWSIDRHVRGWLCRLRGSEPAADDCLRPAWGLRLLQFEMALILISAGLWKLAGEPWLDGTALYYVARLEDFFPRFPTPAWLFDNPWQVAAMTWSVLALELLAPLLIWFRETRRWTLLIVILFHLANEYTMNLFLFHWVMLVGWLSFVTPDDWAWIARGKREGLAA
jgi:hypothetical protein